MGTLAKQALALLAGQMSGGNQKAKFIVKGLRASYMVTGTGIALVWYSAYRNERVAPGSGKFPFPGVSDLKRKFSADRPEKELARPAGAGATGVITKSTQGEPSASSFSGLADGKRLLAKHPELKPGVARVVETILTHFPQLVITSTTGGNHVSGSYHYLGRAVDIGGDSQTMQKAAEWIERNLGHILTEGIHNPGLSIKDKHSVPSSFWKELWAAHTDHIHVAV